MAARFLTRSYSFRELFRILYLESFFVILYETWVSSTYLSGLAGELRISLGLVSVLAAIPSIGAIGQLFGVWAFEKSSSVKSYVMNVTGVGRILWVIPLLLASGWGLRTFQSGVAFPVHLWFVITACCACLSSILVGCSTNAGMFWMKELVPLRFQGRFFGYRQRFSTAGFVGASALAAILVGWSPLGYRLGAGLLCLFGLVAGAAALFQSWQIEDVSKDKTEPTNPTSFTEIFKKPLADLEFRNFLAFGAMFNGAIQLVNSYFPYYFTKELQISLSSVALWIGISNLGCFVSATYWGRKTDKHQAPYRILWQTGHFLALCPLGYLFLQNRNFVQGLAPLEYFLNGLAWSGFSLAQIKILLRLSPSSGGAAYFSIYTALCGVSGALFTFLGGQLVHVLVPWGGFRALWLVGSLVRLAVLWVMGYSVLFQRPVYTMSHSFKMLHPPSDQHKFQKLWVFRK